jgi:uncharacterized protein (DUF2384 family)
MTKAASAKNAMTFEEVSQFFYAGLKREKLDLSNREQLLAMLAQRIEVDASLAEIVQFALRALEGEEGAYTWLVQPNLLLNSRSPVQAMLGGDGALVRQLLASIEYGLSV